MAGIREGVGLFDETSYHVLLKAWRGGLPRWSVGYMAVDSCADARNSRILG